MSYDFIMLPKEYRLKKRSAFTATYKINYSYYEGGVTFFCGKKKKGDFVTKIGFVVSKKIHKRAVKRNRIRRLLREACRIYIKMNGFDCKYMSIVIVASSKLLKMTYNDIHPVVTKLMDKITHD